jgi:hypothetical protein
MTRWRTLGHVGVSLESASFRMLEATKSLIEKRDMDENELQRVLKWVEQLDHVTQGIRAMCEHRSFKRGR